jgi:hypothetical protein
MSLEKFDQLTAAVTEARKEYEAFKGGKKIAATRARKHLQDIKRLAQDIRNDIQGERKPAEGDGAAPATPAAPTA